MTTLNAELLQPMMSALADVCDGAHDRDGAGFSAVDVWNGHYLAGLSAGEWSEADVEVGHYLACYYRHQLESMGYAPPAPAPTEGEGDKPERPGDAWEQVKDAAREAREEARRKAREEAHTAALTAAAAPPVLGWAADTRLLTFRGNYHAERVAEARNIPGRRWDSENKRDTFPLSSLLPALAFARKWGAVIEFDPEDLETEAEEEARKAQEEAERKATAPQVTRKGAGKLRVTFAYDPALLGRFKAEMKLYQPRFHRDEFAADPADKAPHWVVQVPERDLFDAVRRLADLGLRIDPALQADAEQRAPTELSPQQEEDRLARARFYSKALEAPAMPTPGVTAELMPHQYVPLLVAAEYRRLLLADAPGLGKTLESIAILSNQDWVKRAVIICPSNLVSNWAKEFEMHAPGRFEVEVLEGQAARELSGDGVKVVGWAVLTHWVDALMSWAPDGLIVDEAHYGKAGSGKSGSARAAAALKLSEGVQDRAGLILAMTGTPIVNRPLELLPLLEMLGMVQEFGGAWEFKERYCGPEEKYIGGGQYRTTYTGATNTAELHERLVDSGRYVRRTKQMLVEAGKMGRKFINGVDAYDYDAPRVPAYIALSPDEAQEYNQVTVRFREFVEELVRQEAEREGLYLDQATFDRIVKKKTGQILPQIGIVRQALGRLKQPHVMAYVDALVAQGEQVVIAAHHREQVDAYAKRYGGLKIQGGMGTAKIEQAKAKFNGSTAATYPALSLAIEAGKTGHTLCLQRKNGAGQECARMVFAEETYVPGDEEQAQDRIWRIGQSRDVHVTNLVARGTLDEGLFALRESKRGALASVIDGEGDVDTEGAVSYLTGWLMTGALLD